MPSLLEIQVTFMRALLDAEAVDLDCIVVNNGASASSRAAIYANNARVNFINSLALTYPALMRLVGEDYFRQCARAYMHGHPSRSGDLYPAGADFPQFIADLHGSSDLRYLVDIAALEWAHQESQHAAPHAPLDLARLRSVPAEQYQQLRFRLHPSARLIRSDFPILRIWQTNLQDAEPPIIDLTCGADRLALVRPADEVRVLSLSPGEYDFLDCIRKGADLAVALQAACIEPGFNGADALQRFVVHSVIVDF
jgi:Putative DNA-binding domain